MPSSSVLRLAFKPGRRAVLSRRVFALALMSQACGLFPSTLHAQEGVYLAEAEAPRAVFPHATAFERTVVPATPELRAKVQALLGTIKPSLWEPEYIVFTAKQDAMLL